MTQEMIAYYAQRAAEYERVYDMPHWQDDLAWIRTRLPAFFAGWLSRRGLSASDVHRLMQTGALFTGGYNAEFARQCWRWFVRPPQGMRRPYLD